MFSLQNGGKIKIKVYFSFQDNVVGSSNAASVCSASDLENMKQEILREMKIEMNKMKQEIIEGETECYKEMNKIKQEIIVGVIF
jgi:hypothetical protein